MIPFSVQKGRKAVLRGRAYRGAGTAFWEKKQVRGDTCTQRADESIIKIKNQQNYKISFPIFVDIF